MVTSSTTHSSRKERYERHVNESSKATAPVQIVADTGGAPAGGGQPRPEPQRLPGSAGAGRASGTLGPHGAAPAQGGLFRGTKDVGGLRLVVQPLDQEEAGLRPGQRPLPA